MAKKLSQIIEDKNHPNNMAKELYNDFEDEADEVENGSPKGHHIRTLSDRGGAQYFGKHEGGKVYSHTHLRPEDTQDDDYNMKKPSQKFIHDQVKKQNPHLSDDHAKVVAKSVYKNEKHWFEEDK